MKIRSIVAVAAVALGSLFAAGHAHADKPQPWGTITLEGSYPPLTYGQDVSFRTDGGKLTGGNYVTYELRCQSAVTGEPLYLATTWLPNPTFPLQSDAWDAVSDDGICRAGVVLHTPKAGTRYLAQTPGISVNR